MLQSRLSSGLVGVHSGGISESLCRLLVGYMEGVGVFLLLLVTKCSVPCDTFKSSQGFFGYL